MKQRLILLTLSFILTTQNSYAVLYKIKEYEEEGRIRISFKHTSKYTAGEQKYELISLGEKDIESLKTIRRKPEVYTNYADHTCPSEEDVVKHLSQTLLPRTKGHDSLFPFVLKKVTKIKEETLSKSYETLGLFNLGTGFGQSDRMFGYYTDPGRQLEETEAVAQGRPSNQVHYENWGNGVGNTVIKIMTHFVMQFHEKAPESLTVHSKKSDPSQIIPVSRARFRGVLSATTDLDNSRSSTPLINAGLRKLSTEEIEDKGFSNAVKATIEVDGQKMPTIKSYYELTWEEFKENEAKGVYH